MRVFILGLPRSGTSMMTNIIKLLGINIIYTSDKKRKEMDERYKKRLGEYHPNKAGFFEIIDEPFRNYLKISQTDNTGCKLIIPLDRLRLDFVSSCDGKVILMARDPEEIRQSQEAFYSKKSNLEIIKTQLVSEELKLKENKIDFLKINYRDVLDNPQKEIKRIADFIGKEVTSKAINSVNQKAIRFKREELVYGA